jgi:hypothetical protein
MRTYKMVNFFEEQGGNKMIPYRYDYIIGELNSNEFAAQGLVEAYTGKVVPRREAVKILRRIPDHKWYLSERLGRDVGTRVAAVDFLENFYEPPRPKGSAWSKVVKTTKHRIGSWVESYLTAKSGLTPL